MGSTSSVCTCICICICVVHTGTIVLSSEGWDRDTPGRTYARRFIIYPERPVQSHPVCKLLRTFYECLHITVVSLPVSVWTVWMSSCVKCVSIVCLSICSCAKPAKFVRVVPPSGPASCLAWQRGCLSGHVEQLSVCPKQRQSVCGALLTSVAVWNNLPGHVMEAETLGLFKTRLDNGAGYYLVCG